MSAAFSEQIKWSPMQDLICTSGRVANGKAKRSFPARGSGRPRRLLSITAVRCTRLQDSAFGRFLLHELLTLIEAQDHAIKQLEQEIERHLHPFEEQVKRCEKITEVSREILHVLMAEVGTDL
jgi:hypothetical protein